MHCWKKMAVLNDVPTKANIAKHIADMLSIRYVEIWGENCFDLGLLLAKSIWAISTRLYWLIDCNEFSLAYLNKASASAVVFFYSVYDVTRVHCGLLCDFFIERFIDKSSLTEPYIVSRLQYKQTSVTSSVEHFNRFMQSDWHKLEIL